MSPASVPIPPSFIAEAGTCQTMPGGDQQSTGTYSKRPARRIEGLRVSSAVRCGAPAHQARRTCWM